MQLYLTPFAIDVDGMARRTKRVNASGTKMVSNFLVSYRSGLSFIQLKGLLPSHGDVKIGTKLKRGCGFAAPSLLIRPVTIRI